MHCMNICRWSNQPEQSWSQNLIRKQKENRSSHAEQRLLRIFFITFRSLSVTMNWLSEAVRLRRGDVRHFRSSLMSGWKLNWIQLRPELRILLRLLRRPKPNLRRQISIGKGKQPVNLQLPIWHRKQSRQLNTIFLHLEIIFTMV